MRTEMKRLLLSPIFYAAMLVFFLCLQGYSSPSYYRQWISPYGSPLEYRESALSMTLGGIFFGGAILLLPFCASMGAAPLQIDDLRSGMTDLHLIRSSLGKYIAQKLMSAFISGFLIGSVAFALHAMIWNGLTLPYDPVAYPEHGGIFVPGTLFHDWAPVCHGLLIYLEITVGIGFTAGVWAVIGMATAVWVPDKLLSVTIPMCLYKLWSANISYYLFGVLVPNPSTLYNDAQTVNGDVATVMAYLIVLAGGCILYVLGLRKMVRHE